MARIFTVGTLILLLSRGLSGDDSSKLPVPAGWGQETIELPPGFATDMKLKGMEYIRFAPGMMNADSDSFFSYAFVFELQKEPELTEAVVETEFLKYYRGLCAAVLNGAISDFDPSKIVIELVKDESEERESGDEVGRTRYSGVLEWTEPFVTKRKQKLNLEISTWASDKGNFVFACASPQQTNSKIWQQLRALREQYQGK